MSRAEEIKHLLEKSRKMSVDETYPITEGEVIEFISSSFEFGFVCGALSQKQQDQSTIELAEDHAMLGLTSDDTKRAVEIAREEMIEWLKDNASNYIINTTPSYPDADFSAFVGGKCWEDLKQAMKDE